MLCASVADRLARLQVLRFDASAQRDRTELLSIHVVQVEESRFVCLVGVTRGGHRLYFSNVAEKPEDAVNGTIDPRNAERSGGACVHERVRE